MDLQTTRNCADPDVKFSDQWVVILRYIGAGCHCARERARDRRRAGADARRWHLHVLPPRSTVLAHRLPHVFFANRLDNSRFLPLPASRLASCHQWRNGSKTSNGNAHAIDMLCLSSAKVKVCTNGYTCGSDSQLDIDLRVSSLSAAVQTDGGGLGDPGRSTVFFLIGQSLLRGFSRYGFFSCVFLSVRAIRAGRSGEPLYILRHAAERVYYIHAGCTRPKASYQRGRLVGPTRAEYITITITIRHVRVHRGRDARS